MPRQTTFVSMSVPVTVGTGIHIEVTSATRFSLYFMANGAVGTWNPQFSMDFTNWFTSGVASFTDQKVLNFGGGVQDGTSKSHDTAYAAVFRYLRIQCTAYTSGTPTVQFMGEWD